MDELSVNQLASNNGLAMSAMKLKQPLHSKVRAILREHILKDFLHGQRFFSERTLIDQLGVSQPTVRRAVTDLVSEGYLRATPRRGIYAQHHTKERHVGLIRPSTQNSPFPEEQGFYSAVCRQLGYSFNPHLLQEGDSLDDLLDTLKTKPGAERIIMIGFTVDFTLKLNARLHSLGYQQLVVGPHLPNFNGSSLSIDHQKEIDQILDHLLSLGHEKITFMVNEHRKLLITNLRAETVANTLIARKLKKAKIVYCQTPNWTNSFDSAYRKCDKIFNSKDVPTALVPLSGSGAWATLRYAVENGIKVPDDLSLMSFDPMINADLLPVPMTELAFSQVEMATTAIKLLWEDSPQSRHEKISPQIIIRKSTGPAR